MSNSTSNSAATTRPRLTTAVVPALSVAVGIAYLVTAWVGGHPRLGLGMCAIMLVFAVGIVAARRHSETVRSLLDLRDERIVSFDLKATAFTGLVMITAVGASVFVDLTRGRGPHDAWIGAVAGLAYLVSLAWQRVRG